MGACSKESHGAKSPRASLADRVSHVLLGLLAGIIQSVLRDSAMRECLEACARFPSDFTLYFAFAAFALYPSAITNHGYEAMSMTLVESCKCQ